MRKDTIRRREKLRLRRKRKNPTYLRRERLRNKARMQKCRAANIAQGLCQCGNEPIAGRLQCQRCTDRDQRRRPRRLAQA